MTTEVKTNELDLRKFILVTIFAVIAGIWGIILPGRLSLSSNINLGVVNISPQIGLIIGLIISVIFLVLGISREWFLQIGSYITIQSIHLLMTGSIIFILTSFTFNGLDIVSFFIYYYEIILVSLYTLTSIYGLSFSLFGFDFSFNYISIVIFIVGGIAFLIGVLLARKKADLKIGRWLASKQDTGNYLIAGVVMGVSTFFIASLYQPTYVEVPGDPQSDGILKTINGLPLGSTLITAVSDFYLDLVIYLYPLVIFICGIFLLRYSLRKSSQPEPIISNKLSDMLEDIPNLIKRTARYVCGLIGIFVGVIFLIVAVTWATKITLFNGLLIFLFKNGAGLWGFSIFLVVLVYLPKVIKPFLEGRILLYTARRLLAILPIFVGISIICYGLMLATGSPVDLIMSRLSPGPGRDVVYQDLMRVYGLNAPYQSQWFNWFAHFLMGDLGNSIQYGMLVSSAISNRLLPTLEISVIPLLLTLIISVPLGIYAALRQYSWKDNTISVFVAVGLSMPIFLLILLCILIFAYYIPILPPGGMTTEWMNVEGINLLYVDLYTQTFIRNLIAWEIWDLFFHLIIPVGAITLISLALYVRLVRSGYLEVIRQDYILSAQAYGFDERTIIFRHSLKNVMIPLVTFIGLSIGGLLGGAPITETTLAWPGLGYFGVTSIRGYDYPIVMGLIMVTALLILLANLFADLLYSIIDPRVSL
jgi:peptide/nickel transport system permease protein